MAKAVSQYRQRKQRRVVRALQGISGVPMVQRTMPFWKPRADAQNASRGRLRHWLGMMLNEDTYIATDQWTSGRVVIQRGDSLWCRKERIAQFHEGYIVISKRAPKWLRNWADATHHDRYTVGRAIETWQPLTPDVVKECVDFQRELDAKRK